MAKKKSIQRRLTGIILLTSAVALLVASVAFIVIDLRGMRAAMVRDLASQARNIDYNSTAPLLFGNNEETAESLESLRKFGPSVTAAAVYDIDGNVFARYLRDGSVLWENPTLPARDEHRFTRQHLDYFHTIVWEGDKLGTVYLRSDLSELTARLQRYAVIVAAILAVCFLLAYFLSAVLQRTISKPILRLADVMHKVSSDKDFSVRAELPPQDDEVGTLVRGFNDMLRRVEERDRELEHHRENLEDEVNARTAELRRVNAELETATQHKSEFLANMSHELRTPLNAIIGFSEVLQQKMFGELNDKQDEYVDDILTSGRHLLSLINDILDLSKIEAGRMDLHLRKFVLASAIENASLLVREKAVQHNLSLDVDVDDSIGEIVGDERKIKQVVLNLLSNAVKFTPDGGRISVSARLLGDQVEVVVADTGIGISSDDQDSIFEEFRQVGKDEAKQQGTGLGLTLAKRFVELHGGSISVDSDLGRGTSFRFVLPRAAEEAVEDKVQSPQAQPSPEAAKNRTARDDDAETILVIEDDPTTAKLLSIHLQEAGFGVVVAANAREGLDRARELTPDAITLDLLLPDSDGWSVLKELKADATTTEIPIIVVSLLDDSGKGFALGASEYLVKPVDSGDLLQAIYRCVSQEATREDGAMALIIDDNSENLKWMHEVLAREGFEVMTSTGGMDGLSKVWGQRPDLIVLDLLMAGADGVELIEQLNRNPETAEIPIVALAAGDLDDEGRDRVRVELTRLAKQRSFDRGSFITLTKSLLKGEGKEWLAN